MIAIRVVSVLISRDGGAVVSDKGGDDNKMAEFTGFKDSTAAVTARGVGVILSVLGQNEVHGRKETPTYHVEED